MKAIVFAAGLGTRLKEETLNKPKALVKVGSKPLLQHALEKLKREGVTEVVVNVHHFSNLIIDFLSKNDFGLSVKVSDETGRLLDTGGALKKAAPLLHSEGPVLIYNVDVLSNLHLTDLVQEHLKSGALATLVVRDRYTQRYFRFNSDKRLVGWLNKKTGEKRIIIPGDFENGREMAFSGIHIVSPEIFDLMPDEDCFSITNFYIELARHHLIKGYFDDSAVWMDVGKPEELELARRVYR